MIGQISPKVFDMIDWRYYIVFAVCGFSNALVIWLFFPETAGVSTTLTSASSALFSCD